MSEPTAGLTLLAPPGFCGCGCGEATAIAPETNRRYGRVKGQPVRFRSGHNISPRRHIVARPTTGFCECGCGQATQPAPHSAYAKGIVRGQPQRFVVGHARRRPLADRFWEKVDKSPGQGPQGECWTWTARLGQKNGYGYVADGNGDMALAHRVSYFLTYGALPEDLEIRHSCDYRPCVRPEHLSPGTGLDNMADCRERGRTLTGERNNQAKLTRQQVIEIKAAVAAGESHRAIAQRYPVLSEAIGKIARGQRWKTVA